MEQYLTHTDYALWEVIVNGDAPAISSASAGTECPIPPKTAEQKLARKNELKAKSTLLLAIPDEHLLKSKGLDKTYDRFQKLISQLEIHENTSSTNEAVNTAHDVSTASSQGQASSSTYADDVIVSFFANQSNSPQLDNEDLKQIDTDDLEEMDLKWQKLGFDKTKVECYNCHRRGHFARECRAPRNQGNRNGNAPRRVVPIETPANVLVVQDGIDLKNQLEEALKEKDDLKRKLEKFEESSKNLTKLINSQISAKDKTGLGYDSQMNESEMVHSVFNSRESDVDNSSVNDRFKTGEGFHAVPPPYTGNYKPSRPDLSFAGLDDSVYKTKVSESITTASVESKDRLSSGCLDLYLG
ncbi:ribonuclease H-like domain-containing protein [Tanacetum coccineum]